MLVLSQKEVESLKSVICEKDRTIADLQQQVSSLRVAAIQSRTIPFQSSGESGVILPPRFHTPSEVDASSSRGSSSEEEL